MVAVAADWKAEKILQLMTRHNISGRELARHMGVNHQSVVNWLNGTNHPRDREAWDRMLAFVQAGGKGGRASDAPLSVKEGVTVYRTGIRHVPVGGSAHAGKPSLSMGDVEHIEMVDWGGDFDRWGKYVEGFSMEPELEPEDCVIFENRKPEQWHVVHALKDGEDVIKLYDKAKDQLVSLAEGYAPLPGAGWEILGVGIQRRRKGEQGIVDIREYPHGMRFAQK